MPTDCAICTHAERKQIDRALADKNGFRSIGKMFSVDPDDVRSHKAHTLRQRAAAAQRKAARASANMPALPAGSSAVDQLTAISERLSVLASTATELGNVPAAIAALREIRECLAALREMQPQKPVTINVTMEDAVKRLLEPSQEEIDREAQLREIAPAILLEVAHPRVWEFFRAHLALHMPRAMDEAKKLFSTVTQEEKDDARREIESDLNGGIAPTSQASQSTSKPN